MATKMVASIVNGEREEDIGEMRKWFASGHDVRNDQTFAEEVWAFFAAHGVLSIVMPDRIIGCPHEEGIDYEGRSARNAPSGPIATGGRGRSSIEGRAADPPPQALRRQRGKLVARERDPDGALSAAAISCTVTVIRSPGRLQIVAAA